MFKERQKKLIHDIQQAHPSSSGLIILFAGFENHSYKFYQESSFYYLTGIEEPGVVLTLDFNGTSTLYIPRYKQARSQWMAHAIEKETSHAQRHGVTAIEYLGEEVNGYQFSPLFSQQEYAHVITALKKIIHTKNTIFTLMPNNQRDYVEQQLVLMRLETMVPEIKKHVIDISPLVARMRRKKSGQEIIALRKAIEITLMAQQAAAYAIADGASEMEIQAGIEYMFTESGASCAFPSIVASGKNSTVLHYHGSRNKQMRDGELVVVDIGARFDYYCADITRTFPVSGVFNSRQRVVYECVLEAHRVAARAMKPGMWINNKEKPDMSLYHIALAVLTKHGYANYFNHGIGHFLGIDVHDVGTYTEPLQDGDVITIEPGIYIPQESIGIRIEDDYLVTSNGAVCLSKELPQPSAALEDMMSHDEEDEERSSNNSLHTSQLSQHERIPAHLDVVER